MRAATKGSAAADDIPGHLGFLETAGKQGAMADHSPSPQYHHNYAGYGVDYSSNAYVTHASAVWTVPSIENFPSDTGDDVRSSIASWIGIGGPSADDTFNTPLAQVGSYSFRFDTGGVTEACFWEIPGVVDPMQILHTADGKELPCEAGDRLSVAMSMTPLPNSGVEADFSVWNETRGKIADASYDYYGHDWGNIVRYVTERPAFDGAISDLPDFHVPGSTNGYTFHDTDYTVWTPWVGNGGTPHNKNLDQGHNVEWDMHACLQENLLQLCTGGAPFGGRIAYQGGISSSSAYSTLRDEFHASCEPDLSHSECTNP